jgi:PAS domain S-box-containing protein
MITVLYVDDEPDLLEICKQILERTGLFRVDTALSTPVALDKIHTTKYDAIIADYQMEDINGIELLKIIRNEFPTMPFIIFTGRGREDVVVEAFENGVDFYVQKGGDVKAQFTELAHKVEIAVEHRRVKKKLARSEERFHTFVQNFEGIAFQVNLKGQFYLLEGSVEEITGYPRQEFLSGYVSLDSIIHPDDKSRYQDLIRQLSTKPGFRVDPLFRIIRKDRRTRWLHGIIHNICNKKKEIIHIQGALQDITYLKSAQDELAKTEQKWRSIITRAPVIISVADRKGKLLFINKSRPPRKPSDLIGTSAFDYLAPGQENLMENALFRVFSTGETMRFESSVRLGNDITEWLAHQVSPVSWDGGKKTALIVSTVITERKWLEQNLRDSEEQYRAIVTASGDGIAILDREGIITFSSPKMYDIFERSPGLPFAGSPAMELIDPENRQIAFQRMKNILSGDLDAEPFEYILIKDNGTRFPGELVTTPLRDSQGEISGLLVLIRDISRRKSVGM